MTESEQQEIQQAFAEESAGLLEEMGIALAALAVEPADREAFQRLYRSIHTIKGSAGIVGSEPVEQLAGSIEEILVRMMELTIDPDKELISLLMETHSRMCLLVNSGSDDAAAGMTLTDKLMEVLGKLDCAEDSGNPECGSAVAADTAFGFFD